MFDPDLVQRFSNKLAEQQAKRELRMPTHEITLPDSGAVLQIKRMPPMTLMAIEQQFPDPRPPLQEVDYGNGSVRREPNPLDPEYQFALAAHQRTKSMLMLRAFIKFSVVVDVDKTQVADYRAAMQDLGVTVSDDDKYVYVANILCESSLDLETLRNSIQSTSVPTEAAITERAATFQGEFSGNGHLEVEDSQVGS